MVVNMKQSKIEDLIDVIIGLLVVILIVWGSIEFVHLMVEQFQIDYDDERIRTFNSINIPIPD